eukprot:scaffold5373_cov68-Phaeocystis_antarctica.AAC.6
MMCCFSRYDVESSSGSLFSPHSNYSTQQTKPVCIYHRLSPEFALPGGVTANRVPIIDLIIRRASLAWSSVGRSVARR